MNYELDELGEASLDGVPFPCLAVRTVSSQRTVNHPRFGGLGDYIENTGFEGAQYEVVAYMANGISRGPQETWEELFPKGHSDLLISLSKPGVLEFVHPIYGPRDVKVKTWSEDLLPENRRGVTVTFTVAETVADPEEDLPLLQPQSGVVAAKNAIADLEIEASELPETPEVPDVMDAIDSVSNAINEVEGAFDQIELIGKQISAKIDRAIGALDKAGGLLERAGDLPASAAHAAQDVDKSLDALYNEKKQSFTAPLGYVFRSYNVEIDTDVNTLSDVIGVGVDEILRLNPLLIDELPLIPEGSIIRYWGKK